LRKNIGKCFLNRENNEYLSTWELDNTSLKEMRANAHVIDHELQAKLEHGISDYIRTQFSFSVIELDHKEERLLLKSKLISNLSVCPQCRASKTWLGQYSPKDKIREVGLWQVNELYKEPLNESDLLYLKGR
jgi:hypothetical protein